MNVFLSIAHTCFVKGDQTNFEIEPSIGVEASELYPEVEYTTVDEFLNQFIWKLCSFPKFYLLDKSLWLSYMKNEAKL